MDISHDTLPIVFIHQGNADYLQFSLGQARFWNPTNDIFLLGDESNNAYPYITHLLLSSFNEEAKAFKDIYTHFSSNEYEFELMCFQRWFMLRAFMKELDLQQVALIDSDVLLFDEIEKITPLEDGQWAGYCIPKQNESDLRWSASPHVSVWTREMLDQFCEFCMDTYTNRLDDLRRKWKHHQDNQLTGGVCDMTLLYLFYLRNQEKIVNFLLPRDGAAVNNSFSGTGNYEAEEFQLKGDVKKITMKEGKPYASSLQGKPDTRFSALHFQGGAKRLMIGYYTGQEKDNVKRFQFRIKAAQQGLKSSLKNMLTR